MKQVLVLSWLLAVTLACSTQSKDESAAHGDDVAALEANVMALHDSVMPRMSDIMRLKKAVSAKLATNVSAAEKERGLAIKTRLESADNAMMDWMHGYNGDTLARLDKAQAAEYLNAEKRKIEQVRERMQQSIAEAEAFVGTQQP